VGEIEQALGITQPTLSQQLGVLRRQQLVKPGAKESRSSTGCGTGC
jgi:DNA-binding transcriptional ArsR family regulator